VDDKLFSALPDWAGRIWWASQAGVVGTIEPESGTIRTLDTNEQITNSFAVDETGGVYIVSDAALYRFDAGESGVPVVTWREQYANTGVRKPGQVSPGSGTTPTLLGSEYVAITDNADPMDVVVYRRGRTVTGRRLACTQPVFEPGTSATDNSLIAAGRSLVVENNYGYTGPMATMDGNSTAPGVERVDLDADGTGCRRVWHSDEHSPTVVPKLSLTNGLVYVYTKDPGDEDDPWYLTALDFETGRTVFKRLAGQGFGFNNNYAGVMLGPDGSAYVGVLGGVVMLRDRTPPPGAVGGAPAPGPRVKLKVRYAKRRLLRAARSCVPGRLRASILGRDKRAVRRVDFRIGGRKAGRDRRAPFSKGLRIALTRKPRRVALTASLRLANGQTATLRRTLLACPRR
jgi:hypothetical protein